MRLHVIPSPFYAANGLVLVPSGAGTALVVDPSAGIQHLIREVLQTEGVNVGAVLLTHGHPDHVWDAAEVSTWGLDGTTVPVYLPGPDMYRMDDPASFLPMPLPDFVGEWVKPTDLREMPADSVELTPGVWVRMVPAPGHTEGSAVFLGHSPLDIRVNNQSFYANEECRGRSAPMSCSRTALDALTCPVVTKRKCVTHCVLFPTRWTRTRSSSPATVRQQRWPMRYAPTSI